MLAAYEAALAVAAPLDLPTVLERLVDVARTVVPARFAVLGIADEHGTITQFITAGDPSGEESALDPPPHGQGLLGELVGDRRPPLMPDMRADMGAAGPSPDHPATRALLGVPILIGSRVLGDLHLIDRMDGEPFTADDLAALRILAGHAARAIDRARLYQQVGAERRRAEEQRDRLQVLLDALPSGVMIQSVPDGGIEVVNSAARVLLLPADAPADALPIHGRDYRVYQPDGAHLTEEQRPGRRALHGEHVHNRQLLLVRADGRRIPVLEQSAPLPSADGTITHAVVVLQDVTRMRQAEQLRDDFLALVSHELRTPLTLITGGARLLERAAGELDPATTRGVLADVVAGSAQLDRLLSNLLTLTAVLAGTIDLTMEPVLMGPLARQVAAEVGAAAPNHTFVVDALTGLAPVEADPELLRQVLRNLYENAIKYSPDGGAVRTTVSVGGDTQSIAVTDQGIGLAEDQVDAVFERFHRVGAIPGVAGLGIGLYLCQRLVEAQNGTITAASPGPGRGATFTVTLPIARLSESEDE